jgi:hypothetical protein
VLLGMMFLNAGRSFKGVAAVQNRMGVFMLESLFLAFTAVSALPVSRIAAYRIYVYSCMCIWMQDRYDVG